VAAGSFALVALAWTEEILPEVRRMTRVALLITAYQAAAVFGQTYGQVVEQAIGWQTAMAASASATRLPNESWAVAYIPSSPLTAGHSAVSWPTTAAPSGGDRSRAAAVERGCLGLVQVRFP